MKKETCACCGNRWQTQIETERGSVKLCNLDADYVLGIREQRTPQQKAAWEKFLKRVFA